MKPYVSPIPEGRAGFGRLLLAEWTKLRSVPRWLLTLLAAIILTLLVALLTAAGSGSSTDSSDGGKKSEKPRFNDGGHLTYQALTGDGQLTARVSAQKNSGGRAKAGLMIREGERPGSRYAAIMTTPEHGVRFQADYSKKTNGRPGSAPRWLRLNRSGATITGYESADGTTWNRVGSAQLANLSRQTMIGMFVASPEQVKLERQFGSESVMGQPSIGKASFDNVRAEPAGTQPKWRDLNHSFDSNDGKSTQAGGVFTLAGSGDVGPFEDPYAPDFTESALTSIMVGLMAVVALAVLFITSEYKRGTIRLTFAANPRRGQVLAAKATVLGLTTFAAGLVASLGAFLLAAPIMRSGGDDPGSLSDGPVLRAVLGTAALLAVIALLSLGVATLLRRSAVAITLMLVLLLVPQIIATGLPLSAAKWLERLTPSAGFSVQQTIHRYDTAMSPWAGFAVICGYAAVTLVAAGWRLRRRDA